MITALEPMVMSRDGRDRELTELAVTGNSDAFDRLITQYRDKAHGLARRLTETEEDAEDVLQEAFFNAFRGISRFNGKSRFSTWLYRIVLNCALTKRRRRKLATVSLDEAIVSPVGSVAREFEDTGPDPLERLIAGESREILSKAIDDLPSRHRAAFVLKHVENLSGSEIARILNVSVPAIKARLHRTRLALRESLSEHIKN
jgi:RNA polymerase sigma-70 factor (ECF subfamily)